MSSGYVLGCFLTFFFPPQKDFWLAAGIVLLLSHCLCVKVGHTHQTESASPSKPVSASKGTRSLPRIASKYRLLPSVSSLLLLDTYVAYNKQAARCSPLSARNTNIHQTQCFLAKFHNLKNLFHFAVQMFGLLHEC